MALSSFQPTLPFGLPFGPVPTTAIPLGPIPSPLTFANLRPTERLFTQAGLQGRAGISSPGLIGGGFHNSVPSAVSGLNPQLSPREAFTAARQKAAMAPAAQARAAEFLQGFRPLSAGRPVVDAATAARAASMPADTLFANSLGNAVKGGAGSFAPVGAAPLGFRGAATAGLRGALPGAGAYMAGGMLRGMGDEANNDLASGAGLGVQAGGLTAAGSGILAGAAPSLGVSALPVLPAAAAAGVGVGLGNAITGSGWGNSFINSMRGGLGMDPTDETFTDLFSNGGALSSVPLLGQGEGTPQLNLTAEGLKSRLDSMNLSPETRAQAVTDFNTAVTQARAGGMDNTTAMTAVYNQMFGATDAEGKSTPGAITNYQTHDQELGQQKIQDQETSQRAVALQSLMAQLTPGLLAPMQRSQEMYNAMAPGVIASLPGSMQGWAQKQGMDFNANQDNRLASTMAFLQQMPLALAQQQAAGREQQIAQMIQQAQDSQMLKAAGVTGSPAANSGIDALIAQATEKK